MRAIDFLVEYQKLDEVNMSPSSLKMLVKSINATAGMEFEMCVPNMENPDADEEYEPDYDSDERASSWGNIEDFFMGGDGNNSRSDVRSMISAMQEQFMEWYHEKEYDDWREEGLEYLKDYIQGNDEFDAEEAEEMAKEEVREANPRLPEDSEDFKDLVKVRVDELFDEFVESEYENEGRIYDRAYEQYTENYDGPDEGDWLHRNYQWMTDVFNEFGSENDVFWPYYSSTGGGEGDLDQLAEIFSDAIGRDVNTYHGHGGDRVAGEYTIETDPSIDTDSSDDAGLEFVSPPLPLTELVSDLAKVVQWAKEYGCYTNESTGLHMSVSVPNYSIQNLDYVKLALLMGDQYVLEQFGRASNNYCRSAIGKVQGKQLSQEESKNILDQMKNGLSVQASKLIHTGMTDKYTSINTKSGYVEFRSPGGDWLSEDLNKLTNTLYRFVVALDAACDPQKYKEEYYKKLYKMLNPSNTTDNYAHMINDFSQYVTAMGGAPLKVVSDFRRLAIATLKQAQGKETGKWWYNVAINGQRIELVADSPQDAWEQALDENPHWGRLNPKDAKINRLRPFEDPANAPQVGHWGLWAKVPQRFARMRNEEGSPLRRFRTAEEGQAWLDSKTLDPNKFEIRQISTDGSGVPAIPNFYIADPNSNRIVNRYYAPDLEQGFIYFQRWKQRNDPNQENQWTYGRLTHDIERQYAQAAQPRAPGQNYEIYRGMSRDDVVAAFVAPDDQAAIDRLRQYRETHPGNEYNVSRVRVTDPRDIQQAP